MGAGIALHLAQQDAVVELLGPTVLDLAQPGDELVAAPFEPAEVQQPRHARRAVGHVAAQPTARTRAQVADDRDGELLLEPRDLPAQGAAGGVLVGPGVGGLRGEAGRGRGGHGGRGAGVRGDDPGAIGTRHVVDLLQSFDPAHPLTPSAVAV